ALGMPKIQRFKLVFMPDGNTTLAAMLAGEVHLTVDSGLPPPQVATLKQQWAPGAGTAILYSNQWRAAHFQARADFVKPAALQDPRVRKVYALTIHMSGGIVL